MALNKELSKLNNRVLIQAIEKRIELKRPGAGGTEIVTYGYEAEILVEIGVRLAFALAKI